MNNEDRSFRLDRKIRSFRVTDFAFRDLPLLALAFMLLTLFSLGIGSFLDILPEKARWSCLGLAVGFYFGVVFGSRSKRSATKTN